MSVTKKNEDWAWERAAKALREADGLDSLSPEGAERELKLASDFSLPDDDIEEIVRGIISGKANR